MDEKQIEALNKAVSKLSEEDQAQIAGGNAITDEQCDKIKEHLPWDRRTVVAYGGPGWWDNKYDLNDIIVNKPKPFEETADDSNSAKE
ncbi:MAG: hypothetical protein Q4D57_01550 [Clostridia bacterium]|nr:hypothetical protein [Clostridia bacterium]